MNINVKRQQEDELVKDSSGNLCVLFTMSINESLSEDKTLEAFNKIVKFLTDFGREKLKDHKGLAGQINTLHHKDRLPYDRPVTLRDYSGISVRVGYAQDFQEQFKTFQDNLNAELDIQI